MTPLKEAMNTRDAKLQKSPTARSGSHPVTRTVVCIVDDDDGVREGLASLFVAYGYPVEAHASAASFLASPLADVACIVLDLRIGPDCGLAVLDRLSERGEHPPVLVLTAYGDIPTAVRAMRAGAADFLDKAIDPVALVRRTCTLIDEELLRQHRHQPLRHLKRMLHALTRRELEVLTAAIGGMNVADMAQHLGISERTIETHRSSIVRKFGVPSLAELFRIAAATGFPLLQESDLALASRED